MPLGQQVDPGCNGQVTSAKASGTAVSAKRIRPTAISFFMSFPYGLKISCFARLYRAPSEYSPREAARVGYERYVSGWRRRTVYADGERSRSLRSRRAPLVSPRTLELEQGVVKHLSRHLGSRTLGSLNSDALADYVARRKAEGVGNRTVNIEAGVLRRILKQFKLWHLVGEDYKPLPEPIRG